MQENTLSGQRLVDLRRLRAECRKIFESDPELLAHMDGLTDARFDFLIRVSAHRFSPQDFPHPLPPFGRSPR